MTQKFKTGDLVEKFRITGMPCECCQFEFPIGTLAVVTDVAPKRYECDYYGNDIRIGKADVPADLMQGSPHTEAFYAIIIPGYWRKLDDYNEKSSWEDCVFNPKELVTNE